MEQNERRQFFIDIQRQLAVSSSFEELQKKAKAILPLPYELPLALSSVELPFDMKSLELFLDSHDAPRTIYGDGNCLFRTGSAALWGTEDEHVEMRVRVVLEMAVHEKLYLNHDFLSRGLEINNSPGLPAIYCQYLETYVASVLTPLEISRHYRFAAMLM